MGVLELLGRMCAYRMSAGELRSLLLLCKQLGTVGSIMAVWMRLRLIRLLALVRCDDATTCDAVQCSWCSVMRIGAMRAGVMRCSALCAYNQVQYRSGA